MQLKGDLYICLSGVDMAASPHVQIRHPFPGNNLQPLYMFLHSPNVSDSAAYTHYQEANWPYSF